ncbi:hypothetical protein MYBA111488_00635 [Mycobacterium basiliense]
MISPTPQPTRESLRPVAAFARSGRRGPQRRRREWCARQQGPFRSMRPREVQGHCGFGDRPTTAAPPCRRWLATHAAPVPPAAVHASQAGGARPPTSRLGLDAPARRGSATMIGASKPIAVRPPAARWGRARRNPPRHRRCADPPAGREARVAMAARAACRPRRPRACRDSRRSFRPHGSIAGGVPIRRRLGSRPRAQLAPRPRTGPCGANYPPSSWHRSTAPRGGRTALLSSREPPV